MQRKNSTFPVIIWNHRWEHDKNPKLFFKTLFELDEQGFDFKLIILGQAFRRKPLIFSEAQSKLPHKIIHCGYVESRDEYARLLTMGDIVVSTAKHEFYGISVIEAVRAGCYPLLPNSLSYPELFPAQYLYENGDLLNKMTSILGGSCKIDRAQANILTKRYSWLDIRNKYLAWFSDLQLTS